VTSATAARSSTPNVLRIAIDPPTFVRTRSHAIAAPPGAVRIMLWTARHDFEHAVADLERSKLLARTVGHVQRFEAFAVRARALEPTPA
jgi:hypothetical protein